MKHELTVLDSRNKVKFRMKKKLAKVSERNEGHPQPMAASVSPNVQKQPRVTSD